MNNSLAVIRRIHISASFIGKPCQESSSSKKMRIIPVDMFYNQLITILGGGVDYGQTKKKSFL